MRKFNTLGPNTPKEHYALLQSNLVQQGKDGIEIKTHLIAYNLEQDF